MALVRSQHGHRPTSSAVQIGFGMNNTCWLVTALLGMPLAALAQPDPADPAAPTPPTRYQSSFADYKPWQDLKSGDWRAMNNALGTAAAGHGSHSGQAAAPAAAVQSSVTARAVSGQQPPAAGHGAHGKHHTPGGQK